MRRVGQPGRSRLIRVSVLHRRHLVRASATWVAIGAILVWTMFPFTWALLTTLKTGTSVYNSEWIPWLHFEPSLNSWRRLVQLEVLREAMATSAAISIAVATLTVIVAAPASYSIARMKWSERWQKGFLFGFMGQRIMPPVVLISPYLLLSTFLHLRDTMQGLVVINVTFMLPLTVIVVHAGFAAVSPELIEAAHLDGASSFRTFVEIASPLARSAMVAAWVLSLAFTWNEWLYADFMTFNQVETMPVALIAVAGGGGGANVPGATARALSMMVVPISAALATQRFIAGGLSMGAVKS
jgi:multiple sugar transport system permease protein